MQGPTFSMQGVYGLGVTPAVAGSPPCRVYAGVDSSHWGPSLSYSDDLGATWHEPGRIWTSIAEGLPADFGFPIIAHPHRGDTVYPYPLVADGEGFPPAASMRVYRSDDAGRTWAAFDSGLAASPCYSIVLRDAMCTDQNDVAGVYLGTKDASVYATNDDSERYGLIAEHLPSVLHVKAVSSG